MTTTTTTNGEDVKILEWRKKRKARQEERRRLSEQQQQQKLQKQNNTSDDDYDYDVDVNDHTTTTTNNNHKRRMMMMTPQRMMEDVIENDTTTSEDFDVGGGGGGEHRRMIAKRRKQAILESMGISSGSSSRNNNLGGVVQRSRGGDDNDDDYNNENDDENDNQVQKQRKSRSEREQKQEKGGGEQDYMVAGNKKTQEKEGDEVNDDNDFGGAGGEDPASQTEDSIQPDAATEIEDPEQQRQRYEEERILREASKVQTNALQAAKEVAQGTKYIDPMPSTWYPPKYTLIPPYGGQEVWNKIRNEWHMEVQGIDIPPPLKRFIDMKFPKPVMDVLVTKGIKKPTPIQIQGLPVALAGRDMVGIAFTGSGKTLTFTLPLIMIALEEELRMPLVPNEGPIGILLAPSRELAKQTHDLVKDFCSAISSSGEDGYPELRSQLLIGGVSVHEQLSIVRESGVHCVVATPGRLRDVLKRRAISLDICRYICLDEADRMLDMGFDEEVGEIMNYFHNQRQTLLFSATFPRKFQDFARSTLVKPIVVNVGRAGAANLDVIQEVEYVKEEAKIVYLLHCLQKTAPPVIIFCERKGAADDIHEYLLLKGVQAVSIHGGKDQDERNDAIQLFKDGERDVLIATDVAAKGMDFPNAIQHVINYDFPQEIENYVHRIGRTGRAGKTGVATTFINKSCNETALLDLKALLIEAKQRVPPVLSMLDDPRQQQQQAPGTGGGGGAVAAAGGCSFCGGLGHTIVDCPKIDKDARRVAGNQRDVLTGGGDW